MGLFGGEMVQDANLVVEGVVIAVGFLIHKHSCLFPQDNWKSWSL
jgi:hypothetical protein